MEKTILVKFLNDSLLINNEILVLGDFHIGFEECIVGGGNFLRIQLEEILEKLDGVFDLLGKERIKIKKIIVLGDLKHEFAGISDVEWRETLKLLDYLSAKIDKNVGGCKVILVKGNHDNILGPITKKRDIKLKDYYKTKGICFMHGDRLWKHCLDNCRIVIMGHLHPAITIADKYKREKYKCFLRGRWKRREVYVLPSFSPVSFGYDLNQIMVDGRNKEGFLIIPKNKLEKFKVIVYNDKEKKELDFGKLEEVID